jgi:hypothetical protein
VVVRPRDGSPAGELGGGHTSRACVLSCGAHGAQAAEKIVVLDDGRVAEVGTHAQLVERRGLYAELVSSQSLSLSAV